MKCKICGLTMPIEANYLDSEVVAYTGMVLFFEKSKRNIDIAKAKEIMANIPENIGKVAVVVSPTNQQIEQIIDAGFDVIQIHGKIDAMELEGVLTGGTESEYPIKVWRAFNVSNMDEFEEWKSLDFVTGYVFDAADPGSGKSFDYSLLDGIEVPEGKLYILSGGLNDSNVADAALNVHPDLLDVSSGVEYIDGTPGKDPLRVKAFIEAVRGIN